MPVDWSASLAILFLLALLFFLYRRLRSSPQSHQRDFHTTLTTDLRVVGTDRWDALTARQQQVARMAARGLANSEIAARLGVTPNTVDAHLKKIYSTLDVHSRAELSYRIKDQLE